MAEATDEAQSSPSTLRDSPTPLDIHLSLATAASSPRMLAPSGENLDEVNPELARQNHLLRELLKARNVMTPIGRSWCDVACEIRSLIWEKLAMLDTGRVVELSHNGDPFIAQCASEMLVPAILHINQESRRIGLKYFVKIMETSHPRGIYINWATDTFLFNDNILRNDIVKTMEEANPPNPRHPDRPHRNSIFNMEVQQLAIPSGLFEAFKSHFKFSIHFSKLQKLIFIRPPIDSEENTAEGVSLVSVNHDCKYLAQTKLRVSRFGKVIDVLDTDVVDVVGECKADRLKAEKEKFERDEEAREADLRLAMRLQEEEWSGMLELPEDYSD